MSTNRNKSAGINRRCVWPRDQVAHLWAAQSPTQTEAREPGNSRASYFDGATLYSYGSHYVAGHFTNERDADGRRVVLVSGDTYSSTTAKVCNARDRALRGHAVTIIRTPGDYLALRDLDGTHGEGLEARANLGALLLNIAGKHIRCADALMGEVTKMRAEHRVRYALACVLEHCGQVETIAALPLWTYLQRNKRQHEKAAHMLREMSGAAVYARDLADDASKARNLDDDALMAWKRRLADELKTRALVTAANEAGLKADNSVRAYREARKHGADAMQLKSRATIAADDVSESDRAHERAGLARPRGMPREAYFEREAKRLAPAAAACELIAHADSLERAARAHLAELAKGQRYESGKVAASAILTREGRRQVRANIRELRAQGMPPTWGRLARISLNDAAESFADKVQRLPAAARSRATDAAITRGRVALDLLTRARIRATNAHTLRGIARDLDSVRETWQAVRVMIERGESLAQIAQRYPNGAGRLLDDYTRERAGAVAALESFAHDGQMRADNKRRALAHYGALLDVCAPTMPAEWVARIMAANALAPVYREAGKVAELARQLSDRVAGGHDRGSVGASRHNLGLALRALESAAERLDAAYANPGEGVNLARELSHDDMEAVRERLEEVASAAGATEASAAVYLANYKDPTREGWIAGGPLWPRAYDDAVALRLVRGTVQTSHGAEVSAEDARRLWRMVKRVARTGQAVHTPPPIRIGPFELRHIRSNGDVQVGCHFIAYAEARRFAVVMGWADDAELSREESQAVQP